MPNQGFFLFRGRTLTAQSAGIIVYATQITLLRKATKNILYTVVNSNAMNIHVEGYLKPLWQEWMVYIDIGLAAIFALWGIGIIAATKKNPKPMKNKKAKTA